MAVAVRTFFIGFRRKSPGSTEPGDRCFTNQEEKEEMDGWVRRPF